MWMASNLHTLVQSPRPMPVSYTHLDVYKRQDYICDAGQYLADADAAGKKILFEAQLGALRDIDFGIYPLSLIHIWKKITVKL